jgi:pimeloyl-ACP methyl ester carboxylesterase
MATMLFAQGALNKGGFLFFSSSCRTWELTAPWTRAQIKVPVKFIVGALDFNYHIPRVQDYIHKGGFKRGVPFLQEVVVMEEAAHFINEEKPEEISAHIYDFIKKF